MVKDNFLKYKQLRDKYPEFIYEGYSVSENAETLDITFNFNIPGLASFNPTWSIMAKNIRADQRVLDALVFSLGMTELVSYWKTCCSPVVHVKPGTLYPEQIDWWKKLYAKGLGEFFYTNGIEPEADFMRITSTKPADNNVNLISVKRNGKTPKVLTPIGGGKDSAVTLEILHGKADLYAYIINPRQATNDTVTAAGITVEKVITAKRTLDKNMLALNKQGFLNGHTPFSAIVAFSSVITGFINGLEYVALSNESSANETTVGEVNHQYSKSYEFELDFIEYERKYIGSGVEYFSLLRPLTELQIAKLFSNFKQYHGVFRSCNAGSKTDEWCGACPKCLFVYIILSPFISEGELTAIFGKNLFYDMTLTAELDALAGFVPEKPFECVGEREEVCAALDEVLKRYKTTGGKTPPLIAYYEKKRGGIITQVSDILTRYDTKNSVPPIFAQLVENAAKGAVN